jgi:hypothetical protein
MVTDAMIMTAEEYASLGASQKDRLMHWREYDVEQRESGKMVSYLEAAESAQLKALRAKSVVAGIVPLADKLRQRQLLRAGHVKYHEGYAQAVNDFEAALLLIAKDGWTGACLFPL